MRVEEVFEWITGSFFPPPSLPVPVFLAHSSLPLTPLGPLLSHLSAKAMDGKPPLDKLRSLTSVMKKLKCLSQLLGMKGFGGALGFSNSNGLVLLPDNLICTTTIEDLAFITP